MGQYAIENTDDAILSSILKSLTQLNNLMIENNLMLKEVNYNLHKVVMNTS